MKRKTAEFRIPCPGVMLLIFQVFMMIPGLAGRFPSLLCPCRFRISEGTFYFPGFRHPDKGSSLSSCPLLIEKNISFRKIKGTPPFDS